MDCSLIHEDLIAYHFATASDEVRERIDVHLVACTACLRAYLRVKHHIERGASLAERPSAGLRQKLRRDVELAFRPSAPERVRRWFSRPIPLYQGLAAAAVVVLLATVVPVLWRSAAPAPALQAGGGSSERIDTARPSAESLSFY